MSNKTFHQTCQLQFSANWSNLNPLAIYVTTYVTCNQLARTSISVCGQINEPTRMWAIHKSAS